MQIELTAVLTEDDLLDAFQRAVDNKHVALLEALLPFTEVPPSMEADFVSWTDEPRIHCQVAAKSEDVDEDAVDSPLNDVGYSPDADEDEEEPLPPDAPDAEGAELPVEEDLDLPDGADLSVLTDPSKFPPPRNGVVPRRR